MLRFFRQIRQRLLTDNRFSKYLLYAVGEVLLIVIGILIALQLENWNSQSERNKHSQQLLKSLLVELQDDYSFYERYSNGAEKSLVRFQFRNEMIYKGIGPDDLDTLLSGSLFWRKSFTSDVNKINNFATI